MSFTSPYFLFIFLPIALAIFLIAPRIVKPWVILASSLGFLYLTEPNYLLFYLVFLSLNFILGRLITANIDNDKVAAWLLWLVLLANLIILGTYKWLSHTNSELANPFFFTLPGTESVEPKWVIPVGISYVTFQMISYHYDLWTAKFDAEKRLDRFLSYGLFFPKMIVGPIQRFPEWSANQVLSEASLNQTNEGVSRFIIGLSKKVLIADTISKFINPVFRELQPNVTTLQAWVVILSYMVVLYYDFSGYTDMAIGLGKVFGVSLPENFNWPYVSRSVTEFWRRWHISLSSWFRDYVFIPVQFAFRKNKNYPIQLTILLVFFLTGIWHGVADHFIVWGLLLGCIIAIEATRFGKVLKGLWPPFQHIWTLFWIMISWVFFRSESVSFALGFIKALFGLQGEIIPLPLSRTIPFPFMENSVKLALVIGVVLMFPIIPWIRTKYLNKLKRTHFICIAEKVLLVIVLILCLGAIISNGPLPGIYGQF